MLLQCIALIFDQFSVYIPQVIQSCTERKGIFDAYKGGRTEVKHTNMSVSLQLMLLQCSGRSEGDLGNSPGVLPSWQTLKTQYTPGDSLKLSSGDDSAVSPLERQAIEAQLNYKMGD